MNPKCEICGREKEWVQDSMGDEDRYWRCPATPKEHHLCARVAELKAKLADAKKVAQFIVNHWPALEDGIDWGAKDLDDHYALKAANRILEASNG